MGCSYGNELISQERMVEFLVNERKRSSILRKQQISPQISYIDKETNKLRNEFYEDINDESKLIIYLKKLQEMGYNEEFEHELLLYFDSLSPINRTEFTDIKDFDSSLEVFKSVISKLNDFNFNAIKAMNYYNDLSDLCGREKLLNSENFSLKSKFLLKKEDKNYFQNKKIVFSIIEKSRRHQKISLKNPELYFYCLLQSYFQSIANADDYRLHDIATIVLQLYKPICSYLTRINRKEIFSDKENKIINILMYAPIIGNNLSMDIYRIIYSFDNNDNNIINNNSKYQIANDKLIIKESFEINDGKNQIENLIELPKPNIYNINLLEKEIINPILRNSLISEVYFIKYVKLQYFQENNFYTYNTIYHQFNETLFKNILHSKTIKTLFDDIYPNKEYIFDNDKTVDELFSSIIFIPFPIYKAYGMTNKKTLLIFINGLISEFIGPITYLGKSCSFIILGIHEGCAHWASAFYSFLYQDLFLFRSNKFSTEILIEMGIIECSKNDVESLLKLDGGDISEIILFGRKLEYFTLNEILFLLCKKSYNVDYKTFKKNFREINKKNLLDLFQEVSEDTELSDFMNAFKIDWNFFKNLKRPKGLNFSFKRNGDILSNSRCGNFGF